MHKSTTVHSQQVGIRCALRGEEESRKRHRSGAQVPVKLALYFYRKKLNRKAGESYEKSIKGLQEDSEYRK